MLDEHALEAAEGGPGSSRVEGLLEGIEAYQFGENIRIPDSATGVQQASGAENEAVLQPDLVAHSSQSEEAET